MASRMAAALPGIWHLEMDCPSPWSYHLVTESNWSHALLKTSVLGHCSTPGTAAPNMCTILPLSPPSNPTSKEHLFRDRFWPSGIGHIVTPNGFNRIFPCTLASTLYPSLICLLWVNLRSLWLVPVLHSAFCKVPCTPMVSTSCGNIVLSWLKRNLDKESLGSIHIYTSSLNILKYNINSWILY